jgi:hypothetical protein
MDAKMTNSTVDVNGNIIWDYEIDNGICRFITGEEADLQNAQIATFQVMTLIPQLPNIGVDWLTYMTVQNNFGILDASVRENQDNAGVVGYFPVYEIVNDELKVSVTKE